MTAERKSIVAAKAKARQRHEQNKTMSLFKQMHSQGEEDYDKHEPSVSLWYGGDLLDEDAEEASQQVREICQDVDGISKGYKEYTKSGMIQTFWLALRMSSLWGGLRKDYTESFDLPDGGKCAISWFRRVRRSRHVALLMPGLGNSSQTGFVRDLVRRLDEAGFDAAAVDFRGSGIAENTDDIVQNFHTLHDWMDIDAVLDHLLGPQEKKSETTDDISDGKEEETSTPQTTTKKNDTVVYLVGQSMGACCVLSHLGKRKCTRVKAAVAISPPVDLRKAAPEGFGSFFLTQVIKLNFFCNGNILWSLPKLYGRADIMGILKAMTVEDIEAASVCPVFGYESPAAYHAINSPGPTLPQVQCPTLIIHSEDDPIVPPFPDVHACANPNLAFVTTIHGGHLSFLDPERNCWADEVARDFLVAARDYGTPKGQRKGSFNALTNKGPQRKSIVAGVRAVVLGF